MKDACSVGTGIFFKIDVTYLMLKGSLDLLSCLLLCRLLLLSHLWLELLLPTFLRRARGFWRQQNLIKEKKILKITSSSENLPVFFEDRAVQKIPYLDRV